MWLPLAATDSFQTVAVKSINAPGKQRILQEREYGDRVLFLELGPQDSGKKVEIRYQVKRLEKAAYAAPVPDQGKYLNPERGRRPMRILPHRRGGRRGQEGRMGARPVLYDHVIDRMRDIQYGEGWGKGDAVYACNARTGNCTDFHALFHCPGTGGGHPAALFAIGAALPSERNEGGVDGYHCWAEFYAEGKWWPVDISEGNKYTSLATYSLATIRPTASNVAVAADLVVEPGPTSGPINFLAYPVLEIGGKPGKATVEFSFTRSDHRG